MFFFYRIYLVYCFFTITVLDNVNMNYVTLYMAPPVYKTDFVPKAGTYSSYQDAALEISVIAIWLENKGMFQNPLTLFCICTQRRHVNFGYL